jgi:hypothetical protein
MLPGGLVWLERSTHYCGSHRSATTLPLKGKPGLRALRSRVLALLQRTTTALTESTSLGIDSDRLCWKGAIKEAINTGDPKECRQHAERCGELARLASTQEARDSFLSLQMTWIRLAMELQQAGALIKAAQEL